MKILLKRKAISIASASILIAVITLISVNIFNTSGPATGAVNAMSAPLRALASNVARVFEGIYNAVYGYERLMAQHDALLRTVIEWERDEREAAQLAEENATLRTLLGFRERHAEYREIPATVTGWSGSNWVSSFTINRGYANSEVEEGMVVVTEYGVVLGQVSDVEANRSHVRTVLDTTFSVSVNIGEAEGIGTLRGDFNHMHSGLMVLDNIDEDLVIMVGDRVVTSGIGPFFPTGLIVGEIHELHSHITGIGRYATVSPIRDIGTISNVFVIIEFGEAGLDVY